MAILDEYSIRQIKVGNGYYFRVETPARSPAMSDTYPTEGAAERAAAEHYARRMLAQEIEPVRDPAYAPNKGEHHYVAEALASFRSR